MDEVAVSPRASFAIFVTALLGLLALMSYQIADPETGRSVLGNVLFRMFSPIQKISSESFRSVVQTAQTYFDLTKTNKRNEVLEREVRDLRIRQAMTSQLQKENERLRQMLNLREKIPYRLSAGEVIARDSKASLSGTLIINRGAKQNIRKETPVVTPIGVVGWTIYVDAHTSKVLLITDASASIGAMLEKDRIAGILAGLGGGRCVLRFLPVNAKFKAKDLVVTSGQEGIFPEGMPIGVVSRELKESDVYKSVEVAPFENFTSLTEVVFITGQTPTPPKAVPDSDVENKNPVENK